MEANGPWLEVILSRKYREVGVAKILKVTKQPAVNKGENYASELSRLEIKAILGSGKTVERSVILKELPTTPARANYIKQLGMFKTEIEVYTELFPILEDLFKEVRLEPYWCQCIYSESYDLLVLEDLKEQYFRVADRRQGLDLSQSLLVMSSLASLHTSTVVAQQRGLYNCAKHSTSFYINSEMGDSTKVLICNGIDQLATLIKETWEPSWRPYADHLVSKKDNIHEALKAIHNSEDRKFRVLCQGDCWTTNMMFKYSHHFDTPVAVKFLDFQLAFFSSYAVDLIYFLFTSVSVEVLEKNFKELLMAYQISLAKTVNLFGLNLPYLPSLDDIQNEVKSYALLGLVICCVGMPFMLGDPETIPDIEELTAKLETGDTSKGSYPMMSSNYKKRAKYILTWCSQNGVFD